MVRSYPNPSLSPCRHIFRSCTRPNRSNYSWWIINPRSWVLWQVVCCWQCKTDKQLRQFRKRNWLWRYLMPHQISRRSRHLNTSRLSHFYDGPWSAPPETKTARAILLPSGNQPSWADDCENCKQPYRSFWETQRNSHRNSPRSCLCRVFRWCYWKSMLWGARPIFGWWKIFSGIVRAQALSTIRVCMYWLDCRFNLIHRIALSTPLLMGFPQLITYAISPGKSMTILIVLSVLSAVPESFVTLAFPTQALQVFKSVHQLHTPTST